MQSARAFYDWCRARVNTIKTWDGKTGGWDRGRKVWWWETSSLTEYISIKMISGVNTNGKVWLQYADLKQCGGGVDQIAPKIQTWCDDKAFYWHSKALPSSGGTQSMTGINTGHFIIQISSSSSLFISIKNQKSSLLNQRCSLNINKKNSTEEVSKGENISKHLKLILRCKIHLQIPP